MLYELKNVTKTYKVNDSINHAIDNISLDIETGEEEWTNSLED